MENKVAVFTHEEFGSIRTVEIDEEIWFVGKDVASVLGYKDTADALKKHCDDEDKKLVKVGEIPTLKTSNYGAYIINESGLYSLILSSKLPKAKEFKHWVTSEVLPSIRKHGGYLTPDKIAEAILNPDTIIKLATALKEEQEKNLILKKDNQIMKPKADYYDNLVSTNLLTNFRDTAKELQVPEEKLINLLLEKKILYRNKGGKLCAYSQYVKSKLFAVKEWCNEDKTKKGTWTLVTPKGREALNKSLKRYIAKHGEL